ncbi:hypothetical protein QTP70_008932 [Hemibagrus guttatus]|uniref:Uncharacterized protein n=1 Tax=Hemibagrus guttatus TaxID=175788 RepID=A0AAE0QB17_9TELE|nr:hypothetical protein QTP70_008932 [Hemibagrus guttatus]
MASRSDAQHLQDSADEDSYQHVPVGILSKESEDVAQHPLTFQLHTSSVGIILEEKARETEVGDMCKEI